MKFKRVDFIVILLLFTLFILLYKNIVPSNFFVGDEPDYMFAVSKGFTVNYLDKETIPFSVFIMKGLTEGFNETKRGDLSAFIRRSQDTSFYRHYHGPLSIYWFILLNKLCRTGAYALRCASLILLFAGSIALYFLCPLLLTEYNTRSSSIMLALLFIMSPSLVTTSAILAPHGLYISSSLLALFMIALFIKTNKLHYFYLSIIIIAINFLVIEFAPFLLVTLLSCIYFNKASTFNNLKKNELIFLLIKSICLFLFTIFLVWPGGLLKLTLIKNYLFFAYFSLIRGNTYGSDSFLQLWTYRFVSSPIEYTIIITCLFVFLYYLFYKKKYQYLLPFLIYSSLIFLATLRNRSHTPTYTSSFLPPLFVITAIMLSKAILLIKQRKAKLLSLTLIIILIITSSIFYVNKEMKYYFENRSLLAEKMVNYFKDRPHITGVILVPVPLMPTMHYYFNNIIIYGYYTTTDKTPLIDKIRNDTQGIIYEGNVDNLEQSFYRHGIAIHIDNIVSYGERNENNISYISMINIF